MATPKVSSFHLEAVVVELAALEDIALEFIGHTTLSMDQGSAQAFRNKCDGFIREGQLQALVEAFVDSLVMVGATASIEDTEARFSILFSLARHLPPDVLGQVVPRIAKVVAELPSKAADLGEADKAMRIAVMRNLYTVIDPRSPTRFGTLVTMLHYAAANEVFGIWDGTAAADVDELCNLWNATPEAANEQKRVLYKLFCDLAAQKRAALAATLSEKELHNDELKEHRFLVRLLETYETEPSKLAEAQKSAARAAVISIKYPLPGDMAVSNSLEENSLEGLRRAAVALLAAEASTKADTASLTASPSATAHLAAVKFLESVPEYSTLHRLLRIFAAEGLSSYVEFAKQNPSALADLGLDADASLRNMRFLTLASLAANSETVNYPTIAKELQVDIDAVERWVIDGITNKVIDAKMDQLNQSIVMNRGSQRLLSDEQWQEVQGKLSAWKNSVRGLLSTIKSVRQEHQILQQQQ